MSKRQKIIAQVEKEEEIFAESMQGLSIDDLEKNILIYSRHLEETQEALEKNQEIKEKAAELSALKKPFQDEIKEYKAKIKQLKKFGDEGIAKEQLDLEIIKLAQKCEGVKIAMADDEAINWVKDELAEMRGPFNDAKKALNLKIAYLSIMISDMRGPLD